MREIGAYEAKNKLSALLDWVATGEEIIITRHGRAVARMVPAASQFDRAKAKQAAANILARSDGASLGGLAIKDLIADGRK